MREVALMVTGGFQQNLLSASMCIRARARAFVCLCVPDTKRKSVVVSVFIEKVSSRKEDNHRAAP